MKIQKYSTFQQETQALLSLEDARHKLLKMKEDGYYTGEVQSAILSIENAINSMDHYYHRRAKNGIVNYPVLENQQIIVDQIMRKQPCNLRFIIRGSETIPASGRLIFDINGEQDGKALPSQEYGLFTTYFKWLFNCEAPIFITEDEETESFTINAVAPVDVTEYSKDEELPSFVDIRNKYIELGHTCLENNKLTKYLLWDAGTGESIEIPYSFNQNNEQERNKFFKANIDIVDYLLKTWDRVATGRYDRPGIIVVFGLINKYTRNDIENNVRKILGLPNNILGAPANEK